METNRNTGHYRFGTRGQGGILVLNAGQSAPAGMIIIDIVPQVAGSAFSATNLQGIHKGATETFTAQEIQFPVPGRFSNVSCTSGKLFCYIE